MYHYLLNVFSAHRAEGASEFSSNTAAAEAARSAKRREAEQQQRILAERRRAYAVFLREAPLGVLLAPRLPDADNIAAVASGSGTTTATTLSSSATPSESSSRSTSLEQRQSSAPESVEAASSSYTLKTQEDSDSYVEAALYAALIPLLSREATIISARALEVLGCLSASMAYDVAAERSRLGLLNDDTPSADVVSGGRLPFLFVSLLLRRWQSCIAALSVDVASRPPSARTLSTLRHLSIILASWMAVTDVRTEEVRAYLEDMKSTATQCVEETLRCLCVLTRAHTSSSSAAFPRSAEVRSDSFHTQADVSTPAEASLQKPAQTKPYVATEAVQVHVWRLLSLLLYWMHAIHGAEPPHLRVIYLFLSTSAAAFDPATAATDTTSSASPTKTAPPRSSDSTKHDRASCGCQLDESHRCTGLNNNALLSHTYVVPSAAAASSPAMWLLSSPVTRDGAGRSSTTSLPMKLMTSAKVRESLLTLLLSASKGAISNVVSTSPCHVGIFRRIPAVETDHDLGFVVVLSCRLLHYAFVAAAGAAPPVPATAAPEQVRDAVSPLLGALSILLARFIAEEHAEGTSKATSEGGDSGVFSACPSPSPPFSAFSRHHHLHQNNHYADPSTSSDVPASLPVSAHPRCFSLTSDPADGAEAPVAALSLPAVRYPRHVRLLGQLGCGILLLTTLFQQSAQAVLDTMDHSFFFDALVTALQAVGKRFREPRAPAVASTGAPSTEAELPKEIDHSDTHDRAAECWSRWVGAVEAVATSVDDVSVAVANLTAADEALAAALSCRVDDHFAVLCDDVFVDEFLHSYLGLLSASRRLRAAPLRPLASRGGRDNDSGLSSNPSLRLEGRSVDTLDQLEQTLVKTFLTAYDVVDGLVEGSAATMRFADAVSTNRPSLTGGSENAEESDSDVADFHRHDHLSPFPATSCLYNLLLKHALWCLRMASTFHADRQPQGTVLLPPSAVPFASATTAAASSSKGSTLTTPAPSLLLTSPQPPPLTSPFAASRSFSTSPSRSPFAAPAHAPAVGLEEGLEDPFLLFLIHHGLFRVLLHDEHFAAAFMVHVPHTKSQRHVAQRAEGAPAGWQRSFVTLHLVSHCLQLRSPHASDLTAITKTHSTTLDGAPSSSFASATHARGNSSPPYHHQTAQGQPKEAQRQPRVLLPSEELVAYETVEALMAVLRPSAFAARSPPPPPLPPSSSSSPPTVIGSAGPSAASSRVSAPPRRGLQWRNCLLSLLTAGLSTSRAVQEKRSRDGGEDGEEGEDETKEKKKKSVVVVWAAAAPVVSEALVRCGGTEYLLQSAIAAAASAAAAAPLDQQDVSFCWAMFVLQGLVGDPAARVHMAATCAKPLLLSVLWNPLLRRGGQRLLATLLCQPLVHAFSTADVPIDPRSVAVAASVSAGVAGAGATAVGDAGAGKSMLSGSKAGVSVGASSSADTGTLAGGAAQPLPRHCRKLCEALWLALCECVNGPLPASNAAAEISGMSAPMTATLVPSAATADDREREAVLQTVLSALVEAFRTLGSDDQDGLGSAEELLPLRTLQRAIFDASREGSMHIYALLLHRLAQSWTSNTSSPRSPASPVAFDLPSPAAAGPVCVLLSADDPMPTAADLQGGGGAAAAVPPSASSSRAPESGNASGVRSSRECVILIVKVLSGLIKANPVQRDVLYRNTIDEAALVDCLANAWSATVQRAARSTSGHFSSASITAGDKASSRRALSEVSAEDSELARLCSYLVYESIDALDAFLDSKSASEAGREANPLFICHHYHSRGPTRRPSCTWSLQNPLLLSALLKRFIKPTLTLDQQATLRLILRTLTHTVENCSTSLYLAASTSLHEMLGQLLPVVALLPPSTTAAAKKSGSFAAATARVSSSSTSSSGSGALTRLDGMLVHLLILLTRCHIDVRQLKQLLMLVIHSKHLRERRALVPLVIHLLSAAAAVRPTCNRSPHHFMTLHRGSGPAGFRAALPEFPLEGYSVSLFMRWEGEVSAGAEDSTEISVPSLDTLFQRTSAAVDSMACCACIFSLRTADRVTVLALMVERHTGKLFVQYRNLQQQEVRVHVAATLPSREWSQVVLTHRPAAFLTAAAGGQLLLAVNDADAVAVPQVAYPLMSRGHLYVGCLGHEVDRLSVAHTFYGQVSTVYFFPFVLQDREREILQSAARASESGTAALTSSSTPLSTPPLRPVSSGGVGSRWPGASALGGGGSSADAGTEQWLADRATLRVDTRLSDRGHLYNLSAVLRGRAGRESRLYTFEGTLVCSTQRVMDSMGLLGALPSVVMPLCTLLVNPSLPISFRGLVAVLQHSREPSALPSWAVAQALHTAGDGISGGIGCDPSSVDATNAALLWALELVVPLASSEAIRNEMADSGLFVFLGQILQLLGPSLQVVVPDALLRLLEALAPFPRLFEDALTNLFLSSEVIHAAPRLVQLRWVHVQQAFLRAHPDALPCLRSLGTSMFVAAEVLRVTAEEGDDADEQRVSREQGITLPLPVEAGAESQQAERTCTARDLEDQWMSYFEALTVSPVSVSEAQSLQYLIENLRWTCPKEAVQLRILRRVRHLVASSTTPFLVQLLGRRNYAVSLIPYIKDSPSEALRLEALLQLLCMVFRSKRTQELMNPVLLSSRDTVVHVAEEVSLSWLKDVLGAFPVTLPLYLALRCGLVGQFDATQLPTEYVPLDESHTLKFAAVLLPLLMLLKRSTDAKLKAYVLTDLAVLLKSDAQAWRRVISVRGWYVSLVGLFASPCAAAAAAAATAAAPGASTSTDRVASSSEVPAALRTSGLLFTTTTMILSYTLFQVLLHESYGATELALVAAYLHEQHLHILLHQVLCGIADRYRSRLLAHCNTRRKFNDSAALPEETAETLSAVLLMSDGEGDGGSNGGAAAASSPSTTASAASFVGLGSATALLNLCFFFRIAEIVMFYSGMGPRWSNAASPAGSAAAAPGGVGAAAAEGFPPPWPSRSGYTEWEELTLLPPPTLGRQDAPDGGGGLMDTPATAAAATAPRAHGGVYYAGEDDDPLGNVRRATLRDPDGRWLHLPLAAKCAELLCSHTALLHLGSNGNTTTISVGTGGPVVGTSSSTGGPGDALLAVVLGAAVSGGPVSSGGSAAVPQSRRVISAKAGPAFLKGGMLRLFARLFHAICRMTLRSATSLDTVIHLADCFLRRVDRGQRAGGFLLMKRAVNAEEAHEHSPIAVTMTMIYDVHELLVRRLHAEESGGSATYPNANAALVDRMKSLVEMYRYSFEQLPAFASRMASYLDSQTGEAHTAGVPTLQWLCDHKANPRRTVEAFAEVASRPDYNAFVERCLLAGEREQQTDKALATELVAEQWAVTRRLQSLFAENSLSRRLVQDNIAAIMASTSASAASPFDRAGGDGQREDGTDTPSAAEDSTDTSFTSFFLPSAVRKVTAAARAATWAHFTMALRGTVWNLEAAGPQQQQQQQPQQPLHSVPATKYVKLSTQEQQPLVHRKLVFDRDGTNYSGVSMASYSSPTSPLSENVSLAHPSSHNAEALFNDDGTELDMSVSGSVSNSRASRLRLRGGEAVLLQMQEDDDAAADEELLRLSAEEEARLFATTAPLSEYPNRETHAQDQLRRMSASPSAPLSAAYKHAVASVLSVACEVPYMMHCWSASFTVRGSEVFVLIDDENKAYNQVVSEDAKPYLLRPRTFSFHLSHVTQIAPGRRFRMRRTALEVWTRDRRSYFINFADAATMNAALQALRAGGAPRYPFMTPSFLRTATGAVTATLPALIRQAAGGGSRHTVYVLQENPRREPMRLRAMTLWRNRLLSNFDYLLVLNLLAGRTLNDMTQYPVFPWILSDYTSDELDLTNPATFRDLSLPMGACGSEDRRAMIRERYTEMKDLGDVPSHYFTHYSSPAVTLYFLIRLPPYTTLSILLQGGHFDHADRMFHSVQASYKAVTTSTQDVRELIPELFYLPELCINSNHVDFGRRQDRTPMDDLQLPPWAHNDPYTFIYRMREALECPHVSAHLHEWIDLVFGEKQRGKEAIDALNVFNWHSYEELDRNRGAGTVDHQLLIDSLDNIGQTPIQLFRQPHEPRPALEWADPLLLPTHVKVLPLRWGCVRVAKAVVSATDKVLVVTGNGAAASLRMHLNLIRQSTVHAAASPTAPTTGGSHGVTSPAVAAHAPSRSLEAHRGASRSPEAGLAFPRTGAGGAPLLTPSRASMGSSSASLGGVDTGSFDVSEEYERRIAPLPAGVIPNNSPYADGSSTASSVALLCYDSEVFLVLGGLFDNSVVIRALSGAASDVRLRAHRGRVKFVVRTGDSRYLITGAEDTTFAVWYCQLQPDRQRLEVELLFTIYGHEDMPSAADVSSTLDVVATASMDGVLMLHSLSTGTLDRVIRHPQNYPIHRVLLQTHCYVPNLIFLSEQDGCVHQYSVNGALLRTFTPPGRVTAWAVTASQYLLLACQPPAYLQGGSTSPTSRGTRASVEWSDGAAPAQAATPCILYVHSFFLEVVKTVRTPADHVVSSISAHPAYPQVVVAGTENGRLLLLRSVIS